MVRVSTVARLLIARLHIQPGRKTGWGEGRGHCSIPVRSASKTSNDRLADYTKGQDKRRELKKPRVENRVRAMTSGKLSCTGEGFAQAVGSKYQAPTSTQQALCNIAACRRKPGGSKQRDVACSHAARRNAVRGMQPTLPLRCCNKKRLRLDF